MNKNSIKKLFISIVFIVFLIISFLVTKNINDNKKIKRISIVKNIVKEKYDRVFYKENSKYIYTLNKGNNYIYDVFDLHGNKLYSIDSNIELNIIKVMKKYYIIYDNKYHLFNDKNEEIVSGSVIESINDYLIRIDDKIINYNNDLLFKDVHTIATYNDNKYININNYYLVNKKGEVLEENVIVNKEIKENYITDFLIIKKGNKYYTFFINLDKIIGDGFDSYHIDDNILIKNGNSIFKLYRTGLRKKVATLPNKLFNDYYLNDNYIMADKVFVINKKNNYFGLYDINNKKFTRITNNNVKKIKKINKNNYCISTNKSNFIFNIETKKTTIKSNNNLENIVLFKNKYMTIKEDKKYILYDNKNNRITTSNKQIIINSPIVLGSVNNNVLYYNIKNKTKQSLYKVKINKKDYYYNDSIVYNSNFDKIIKSDVILFSRTSIIYKNNNNVIFYNKKENKKNSYELLRDEDIVNCSLKDIFIIENNNYIKILDDKGNLLKKIRNRKIVNYYTSNNGIIILITIYNNGDKINYGSYLAE